MRYCEAMQSYPALAGRRVDTVYLDTCVSLFQAPHVSVFWRGETNPPMPRRLTYPVPEPNDPYI